MLYLFSHCLCIWFYIYKSLHVIYSQNRKIYTFVYDVNPGFEAVLFCYFIDGSTLTKLQKVIINISIEGVKCLCRHLDYFLFVGSCCLHFMLSFSCVVVQEWEDWSFSKRIQRPRSVRSYSTTVP